MERNNRPNSEDLARGNSAPANHGAQPKRRVDPDKEIETLRADAHVDGTLSDEPAQPARDEHEDSAAEKAHPDDPVQNNPFPASHPLHQAWGDATHKAEHELL